MTRRDSIDRNVGHRPSSVHDVLQILKAMNSKFDGRKDYFCEIKKAFCILSAELKVLKETVNTVVEEKIHH